MCDQVSISEMPIRTVVKGKGRASSAVRRQTRRITPLVAFLIGAMLLAPLDQSSAESGRLAVWHPLDVSGAPRARIDHTLVWTGTEAIAWGGYFGLGRLGCALSLYQDGARYLPGAGWTPMTTFGAPTARHGQFAVWTGTEMAVWGGVADGCQASAGLLDDGALYNPASDSWRPLPKAGSPLGRTEATAVWTGAEMIIWGGANAASFLPDGGRFNPSTNQW